MFPLFAPLEPLQQAKPRYPRQLYVVRPGDTLSTIASLYEMKVIEVRCMNDLWRGDVRIGQHLHVQSKKRSISLPVMDAQSSMPLKKAKSARPAVLNLSFRVDLDAITEQAPTSQPHPEPRPDGDGKRPTLRARSRSAYVPTAVEDLCRVFDLPNLVGAKVEDILSAKRYGPTLMPKIIAYLPYFCRAYDWQLLFSNTQHGSSMHTLLKRVSKMQPTMVLMETSEGDIFGGFTTAPWATSTSYYGTGEAFVFSCVPRFVVYDWKRKNSMFMLTTETGIAMGGGGGFAWHLDADLMKGSSNRSETFDNDCLASTESFDIAGVEVWGFALRW